MVDDSKGVSTKFDDVICDCGHSKGFDVNLWRSGFDECVCNTATEVVKIK